MKKYCKWLVSSIITFTVAIAFVMFFVQLEKPLTIEASEISSAISGVRTLDNFPTPKLQNPERILGPAGEIFEFSTCNRGDLGFTIANAQIPSGAGPLPHIHHYTNEWFWTPQGDLELFQSVKEYPNLNQPATDDQGGRTTVYTIATKANQITYSPKYHVHGFVNTSSEIRPLIFVWIQDETSPKYPFNDGGIREYFEDVGIPIKDLKQLPPITDEARGKFVTLAPKYGINQSNYFLKYVSSVSDQPPSALANLSNDQGLTKIIDAINAYNQGDQSVKCF
jgi:hypothetical protein